MNITNNRRRQQSREGIEKAFEELLQQKEFAQIRVTEICGMAHLNRTTFYANYEDMNALKAAFEQSLMEKLMQQYRKECEEKRSSFDFLKLFQHIRDNQLAYKTYLKLNPGGEFRWLLYDEELADSLFAPEYLKYHIAFFGNGLNAIIRMWLADGCRETPEEMAQILREEYRHPASPWGGERITRAEE